jgi:protein SCO1/2
VYDEKIGEYAHAGGFLLATPTGELSHYFFGAVFEPVDLRLALVAASKGKLGGLRERFLLLCYHWNPSAGRYGLAILSGTRAAGLATVAAIAALVAGLLRRERRERRSA